MSCLSRSYVGWVGSWIVAGVIWRVSSWRRRIAGNCNWLLRDADPAREVCHSYQAAREHETDHSQDTHNRYVPPIRLRHPDAHAGDLAPGDWPDQRPARRWRCSCHGASTVRAETSARRQCCSTALTVEGHERTSAESVLDSTISLRKVS